MAGNRIEEHFETVVGGENVCKLARIFYFLNRGQKQLKVF